MADTAPVQTTPDANASFNTAAAGDVYRQANTLAMNTFLGIETTPDLDKTIKGSTLDTNLNALAAGYKGTPNESKINALVTLIAKHPELQKGADAMLKDEGANVMPMFADIMSGDMDMNDFAAQIEKNPSAIKMMGKAMEQIGTSKYGTEYMVRFTHDGLDALKNPEDSEKSNKFLSTADDLGLDTSDMKKQGMMDMFNDFMKNPSAGIAKMIDGISFLPPDLKAMFTGIASQIFNIYADIGNKWWNGDAGSPGLKTPLAQIGADETANGEKIRRHAGIVEPTNTEKPTPDPVQTADATPKRPVQQGPQNGSAGPGH